MNYKLLADTGVKVSGLSFGTMTFGDGADRKTSKLLFDECRKHGINTFDCANVYAKGESEKILGKLMKKSRDELVITSKVYFPMGEDINSKGISRKQILLQVEGSLKRNLVCDGQKVTCR